MSLRVPTENFIRRGLTAQMGYCDAGMIDALKLLSWFVVSLFRSKGDLKPRLSFSDIS